MPEVDLNAGNGLKHRKWIEMPKEDSNAGNGLKGLTRTKKTMTEMMVRTMTKIPMKRSVLARVQSTV